MIQITNDIMPNPYDNLPSDSYMQAHLNAVSGGQTKVALASDVAGGTDGGSASAPGGLTVVSFEYTSVSLKWSASANAVGYNIYVNGKSALSLTGDMTHVTIGNFLPGSGASTFQVRAIGGDGFESEGSNTVSSGTKPTPNKGRNIANVKVSVSATSTVYEADILAPYAFIRLYIGPPSMFNDPGCNWKDRSGWPVNFNQFDHFCGIYLIENGALFKYTGVVNPGDTNAPWSWATMGEVQVQQTGYTWKWTVPIGSSTLDTENFVIQTQGYGPAMNVFWPCPTLTGGVSGDGRYCGTNKCVPDCRGCPAGLPICS